MYICIYTYTHYFSIICGKADDPQWLLTQILKDLKRKCHRNSWFYGDFPPFFVNVYQRVTPTDFHSIIFQRGRLNHQPEWLVTQVTSRLQKTHHHWWLSPVLAIWGFLFFFFRNPRVTTWWLIPLSKWVITPVINGIIRVNPLITGVITHLLSGMSHQVVFFGSRGPCFTVPRRLTAEVLSACSSPSTRGSCPMSTWVAPPSCGCWRRRAPWRRPLGCSSCAPSRWCPGHLGEASPWGSLRIGPWFLWPILCITGLLVGGLEHFLWLYIGNVIIPTDFRKFFRGVSIPPTRLSTSKSYD